MTRKEDFYTWYCSTCMACKGLSAMDFCYEKYIMAPARFNSSIFKDIARNRMDLVNMVHSAYTPANISRRATFRKVFCNSLPCPRCNSSDLDVDLCAYEFNGGSVEKNSQEKNEKSEICMILSDNEDFRKEVYKIIENNNKQRDKDNKCSQSITEGTNQ